MAKSKKNKTRKGKKEEIKNYEASAIFGIAGKEAEKAGIRLYAFLALGEPHVFQVKASNGKNPKGDTCIRKGFMLDGKQITAQAARILLDTVGRANGEIPEGRAVAQTQVSLKAMKVWQEKHYFLIAQKENDSSKGKKESKVAGLKKKQLKIEVSKKETKKGLKSLFNKKELKKILSGFGDSKTLQLKDVIDLIDDVSPITTDEIKEAFKNHF